MKVTLFPPVDIALRTLSPEERRKVQAWFTHLGNWENDPHVRRISHRLKDAEDVYVLRTTDDIRIFFKIEGSELTVLDIATRATIASSGLAK
jgi:mRNA-degrading endonuclease RelE of RelBE toxin-antitoxin system